MIRFEIDGHEVDPGNIADVFLAAALENVKQQIAEKIGSIRDPETGEFPTVVVRGTGLDDLELTIEGSDHLIALVSERLEVSEEEEEVSVPTPGQPKVFLSYSSGDAELAGEIATRLQASGIDVWWAPWCIAAGDSLRQKIDEGIGGCTHFLVLLTPESIRKPWVNLEIDAGLVRKLREQHQCRFVPVRHNLDVLELPPTLSGIYSPEIGADGTLDQLIGDIHGVTRRPPVGSPPKVVSGKTGTATGYSAAATAIARLIVERSQHGVSYDPELKIDELTSALHLTEEDVRDALHELSAFVKVSAWDEVHVQNSFFPQFDHYWKPWNPAADALRLAADLVNEPGFPYQASEIAVRYGWEPRRLNPAINWLLERRLIEEDDLCGAAPFTMVCVERNDNLRRFVKSRA
jgi:hypothetical protein